MQHEHKIILEICGISSVCRFSYGCVFSVMKIKNRIKGFRWYRISVSGLVEFIIESNYTKCIRQCNSFDERKLTAVSSFINSLSTSVFE